MKKLKLNLDQLSNVLEVLDSEHSRDIIGGTGGYGDYGTGGYGGYGGYPTFTGNQLNYNGYGYDLLLDEYQYSGFDGSTVTIHKAPAHVSDEVRSNCMGYALTAGEYMIIDDSISRSSFGGMFGYVECSKSEANLVMIYNGSTVSHAGVYNPSTDTYDAKGGGAQYYTRTGMTEDEFYRPYGNDDNPNNDYDYEPENPNDVVYYKKVYY